MFGNNFSYGNYGNYGQNTAAYNPYSNRLDYLQQQQQQQAQSYAPKCEIIRVNGENGARSFRMQPDSQCLLLDNTAPIVWLCQTDGAGYHTVIPYNITPLQEMQQPDFESFDMRLQKIEEVVFNDKSNIAETESKNKSGKTNATNK